MGKKIDATNESFVSSVEEVKEDLAADVAAESEGTDEGGLTEGDPAESPEGGEEPVPVGEGGVTSPFTSDGNQNSYVTRDPDKISLTFTRNLPVPVPDEELAEHAKEMARLHHLWVDTKLKAKAFAKSCKSVTDKAEEDMVTLGAIIQAGTEERPVICRWEYNYAAGSKKLRRMDTWQLVTEETLTGDELHLSFNFNGSSEAAVEKLAELQAGSPPPEGEGAGDTPLTDDVREETAATSHDASIVDINAEEEPDRSSFLTEEELDAVNAELAEAGAEEGPPIIDPKPELALPSGYPCKICGFDAGSHIYLVRHLRDTHALKLSEYKAQYPA